MCVCVCACVLHASLAARRGRDANLISDAVAPCLTPSSVLAGLRALCCVTGGESERQEPLGRATSSAVTAGARRSLQREWSPAPEPQPVLPCGEEHGLETGRDARRGARKERVELVAVRGGDKSESTDRRRNKAHWGCRERGEKGSKRRRWIKEPVMSITCPKAPGGDI